MKKLNCWEVKQCGCCEGGTHVDEKGACPASTMVSLSGVNGGKNGGRSCWAIDWTHCKTKEGGRFSDKYSTCLACSFYMQVWLEEGLDFRGVRAIRRVIEGRQAA